MKNSMETEVATHNVNRSHSLAATSMAIFTFLLFFLYPRFTSGEINALLFLVPSLVLFSLRLLAVGSAWFALWLLYLIFLIHHFPRVQTARKSYGESGLKSSTR